MIKKIFILCFLFLSFFLSAQVRLGLSAGVLVPLDFPDVDSAQDVAFLVSFPVASMLEVRGGYDYSVLRFYGIADTSLGSLYAGLAYRVPLGQSYIFRIAGAAGITKIAFQNFTETILFAGPEVSIAKVFNKSFELEALLGMKWFSNVKVDEIILTCASAGVRLSCLPWL